MYSFEVSNSDRKNKKLMIRLYKDGNWFKTLHVGDDRYADYIQHYRSNASFADERKRLYLLRHNKEDWNDFMKGGYWAKNLLWNKPTLKASITDIIDKTELVYKN